MYVDLSVQSIDVIIKKFRKLDWTDEVHIGLVYKLLTKIWKIKYSNIYLVAYIVRELSKIYPMLKVWVIDSLYENILEGLKVNSFKFNQKRISCIIYFGELYNYRLVQNSDIFQVLFLLIRFGHGKICLM